MENWNNIEASLNEVENKKREASKKSSKLYKEAGGLKVENSSDFEALKKLSRRERSRFVRSAEEVVTKRGSIPELTYYEKSLASFRFENLVEAMRAKQGFEDKLYSLRIDLMIAEDECDDEYLRNDEIDFLDDEITKTRKEIERIKELNPEAYTSMHLLDLKSYKESLNAGGLVETSYVKSKKETLLNSMEHGRPTFIHGHLGAGKSELAFSTARDYLIELNVKRDFKAWLESREEDYSDCQTEEDLTQKESEYKKEELKKIKELKNHYETDDSKEIQESLTYYAVSGSKEFSLSDLYTEKTLDVKRLNGFTPEEFNEEVTEKLEEWQSGNKERLDSLSEEERNRELANTAHNLRKAYELKHSGFGTSVEMIEKEILKGVREGKPVIIDEVNAIPAELLISMNDLLTKRPGQEAFIPGVGKVKIEEGFCIIMTGNINTGALAEYFGVHDLNPAFLSRLDQIDYDYVPQDKENSKEGVEKEKNELFHIILAKMMDKNGNVEVPDGMDGIDELKKLAQFARLTQDVFSGRWKDSDMFQDSSGSKFDPALEKSVLSIRTLSNILNDWNNGREKDINKALWDKFISQASVASDQHYLIQQAQNYGFFSKEDGWKTHDSNIDDPSLSLSDMRETEYKPQKQELEFVDARKVVKIAYGEAPERTEFPNQETKKDIEKKLSLEELKNNFENFSTKLEGDYAGIEDILKSECRI